MVKPSVCTTIPTASNQLFLTRRGSGNRSSYLIAQRRKAKNRAKLYLFFDICKFFMKKSNFFVYFPKKHYFCTANRPHYMKKTIRLFLFVSLLLASCQPVKHPVLLSDTAQYFTIAKDSAITILKVFQPESNALMAQYAFNKPYERIAVTSATHIGFLQALGRTDVVVAMTRPDLIYNHPEQPVADIGEDINLNLEELFRVHPQALLVTSYGQPLPNLERIRRAGIEVIEMVEWREQTPLARADWLRFAGALIGEEARADSLIITIREHYHDLAQQQDNYIQLPTSIMSGAAFRGIWYVPSGGTYMGRLFWDAKAAYAYYEDMRPNSIPLTFETALHTFGDADVWVGCNCRNYEELLALDEHHAWFNAYKNKRVYNWYKMTTEAGANDFWERGITHPDEILEDIITILHNKHVSPDELHYAAPLYELD